MCPSHRVTVSSYYFEPILCVGDFQTDISSYRHEHSAATAHFFTVQLSTHLLFTAVIAVPLIVSASCSHLVSVVWHSDRWGVSVTLSERQQLLWQPY